MSIFLNRLEEHEINNLLKSTKNCLNKILELENISIEEMEYVNRHYNVVSKISNMLKKIDPYLVNLSTLSNLFSTLTPFSNELNNYLTYGNSQHLYNADSYVDQILSYLPQFLTSYTSDELESLRDSINIQRNTSDNYTKKLNKQLDQLKQKITILDDRVLDTKNIIENDKIRIDQFIANAQNQISLFQNKFYEEEKERKEEYHRLIHKINQDSQETLSLLTKNFDSKYHELDQKMINQTEELNKKVTDIISSIQQQQTVFKQNSSNNYNSFLTELENAKKQAEEILGAVANRGLTSGYQKEANNAKISVRIWNGITVTSMILLIAFTIYSFIHFESNQVFNWTSIITRFGVVAAFIGLASYSGLQATHYKKIEVENRRLELELASLDPYLASLPEENKVNMKVNMADKLFGQANSIEVQHAKEQINLTQQEIASTAVNPQSAQLISDLLKFITQSK